MCSGICGLGVRLPGDIQSMCEETVAEVRGNSSLSNSTVEFMSWADAGLCGVSPRLFTYSAFLKIGRCEN